MVHGSGSHFCPHFVTNAVRQPDLQLAIRKRYSRELPIPPSSGGLAKRYAGELQLRRGRLRTSEVNYLLDAVQLDVEKIATPERDSSKFLLVARLTGS